MFKRLIHSISKFFNLRRFVFKLYWKETIEFCKYAIRNDNDVVKGVVTFTKQEEKVIPLLYRRWKNGNITKTEISLTPTITVEDLPDEIANALKISNEVMVCEDVENGLMCCVGNSEQSTKNNEM